MSGSLSLHVALRQAFLTATIPGQPARLVADSPEAAADVAWQVMGPAVERARLEERTLCARRLRDAGMREAADLIDPLGPVQGAPAAGGTT